MVDPGHEEARSMFLILYWNGTVRLICFSFHLDFNNITDLYPSILADSCCKSCVPLVQVQKWNRERLINATTGSVYLMLFPVTVYITVYRAPHWSSGSVQDNRSLPPVFESRCGHIWRLFHIWLRFITFGGRSAHLVYDIHKGRRKTSIIIIIIIILLYRVLALHLPSRWSVPCASLSGSPELTLFT